MARAQLLRAGLASHLIAHRVGRGDLRPVHRGVYLVGPIRGQYAREMAAVLACGPTAVVSHRSAAAVWRLIPDPGRDGAVEVTLWRGCRAPPSVTVHRSRSLPAAERVVLQGLPITHPARTLLDLAGFGAPHTLERAVARAERRGLVGLEELARLIERHPRRAGVGVLRTLLGRARAPAMLRSEAEARFLALVGKARLDTPEVNTVLRGWEVDFLWRRHRLVVEVDGFAFHSSQRAFHRDRERDGTLTAAGYRVMRTTWRQLEREPEVLLARLAQALGRIAG